jgi:hypothetical protein
MISDNPTVNSEKDGNAKYKRKVAWLRERWLWLRKVAMVQKPKSEIGIHVSVILFSNNKTRE